MTNIKLNSWGSADHLKTKMDIALYLKSCTVTAGNDSQFMGKAEKIAAKTQATIQEKRK